MALDDGIEHERELRESWQVGHNLLHEAEDKALDIASKEIDRRLEGMNQIREQINNERGMYVTREVYDEQHNALRDMMDTRLKVLETMKSNMEGRLWAMGAGVSAVVVAINVVIYYLGKH